MENRFEKLNAQIIEWAKEKGILEKATPLAQIEKTIEEVYETRSAIYWQAMKVDEFITHKGITVNTKDEILDGFGDILVTVLIGCKMQGINPLDALETAYNIISKRTGKMINGVFVKEADL